VHQDRVDLFLLVQDQVEVVVPGPGGRDGEPAQQHRRGGLEEQLVPAGHAGSQVTGPDAALLEQLAGLTVDSLDPPDRVGPQVDVLEQAGQPDRARPGEPVERLRVGLGQVERARPPVLVVEQRVPSAQIGERLDPLLLRGPDEFHPPTGLGHARLLEPAMRLPTTGRTIPG
jgi:hypothetical protein